MDRIYKCTVVCSFRVKDGYKEEESYDQSIYGFTLPNGSVVRPIIGLEVENGDKHRYLVKETDMAKAGFNDLDYEISDFEEWVEESESLEHEEYENMPIENIPANLEPRFESSKKIIEKRLKNA